MINIYAIVVLYNTLISDSKTMQSLMNTRLPKDINFELIICDNSTKKIDQNFNGIYNYTYVDMGGNKGLSKAYNAAINTCKLDQKEGYILLLDDDTTLPIDYFDKMLYEIKKDKYQIIAPQVFDSVGLLSPGIMKNGVHCYRAKNLSEISYDNITLINSGLMLRTQLFKGYRYNEEQFLDYIDHSFIRDMKNNNVQIGISEAKIEQDFSINNDSYEKTIIRFNILKKDLKVFYANQKNGKFWYYRVIIRRKLAILLKYKKISILCK